MQYVNGIFLKHLLFLLLVQSLPLHAEPVRFFYSELPPYEQTAADGRVEGIGIKAVTAVFHDAGFTPSFEHYSIQRGLAALQGDIDFTTIVAPSAALQSEFVLSKLPVYSIKLGVLRLRTTAQLADLSSLQQHDYVSLRATEFAYLPDTFALSTEFFAKQYKVDTLDDALRLITHERYAYFLSYYLTRQEFKYPFLVFDELLTLPVYLAMSKAHPKMDEMMRRIDTAMAKR